MQISEIIGNVPTDVTTRQQLKRLVEEPGNYRFCEIEKTSFKVFKFLQRKTPVVNDGLLKNLLHSICINSKMQLLSQNFQI